MFSILRLLFFYLSAPPILLGCILFYAVDNRAISEKSWLLTDSDMQRAKNIVSNTTSKARKTIRLTENDLNIALSYLLKNYIKSTSQISVRKEFLAFKISLRLNNNLFGKYVNLNFDLTKQHGYPTINSLQIGGIEIADEFAGLILENIIKYTPLKEYYILAAQHIRGIHIDHDGLTISYITSSDLPIQKTQNLSHINYQPIIFYQQQITDIIAKHDPKWRLSLAELLQPLFLSAYQRSTAETAISENRAVLIAVSTYVNKTELQAYIPFDISPETDRQYPASLYKRTDMAKHFMASAVLSATGAETFADMIGQEKELNDAKHGSGFSFIDLAGDKAGLRFGKTATISETKARQLQKRMAIIKDYTAFMPEVRDLPESMNATAFKKKFESVDSDKYKNMLKKIDARISKLAIYN